MVRHLDLMRELAVYALSLFLLFAASACSKNNPAFSIEASEVGDPPPAEDGDGDGDGGPAPSPSPGPNPQSAGWLRTWEHNKNPLHAITGDLTTNPFDYSLVATYKLEWDPDEDNSANPMAELWPNRYRYPSSEAGPLYECRIGEGVSARSTASLQKDCRDVSGTFVRYLGTTLAEPPDDQNVAAADYVKLVRCHIYQNDNEIIDDYEIKEEDCDHPGDGYITNSDYYYRSEQDLGFARSIANPPAAE